MVLSSGRPTCPPSPEVIRELLNGITRGRPGRGADLTPQELRFYLHTLVKRVVVTGGGPHGLARWVNHQRGLNSAGADHPSVVAELTARLAEVLLPPADPFTGTVIDRSW